MSSPEAAQRAGSKRPEYLGEPTLGQVMRRPSWILALLLALLVAGVFAWLGRWQMESAIRSDDASVAETETPRPLSEIAEPGLGITDAAAGAVVQLDGALVPGDSRVVSPRDNGGETGAWVVGHLVASGSDAERGAHLAVAIGWAPSVTAAERSLGRLEEDPAFAEPQRVEGRLMPAEGPVIPKSSEDPQALHAMVPAQLANLWEGIDAPVYSGYLVLHPGGETAAMLDGAGLDAIDSVPPTPPEKVNWLNVFYAIEWIVFAGFAVFFWFRLTRDAWEKEHELKLLREADGADAEQGDVSGAQ